MKIKKASTQILLNSSDLLIIIVRFLPPAQACEMQLVNRKFYNIVVP